MPTQQRPGPLNWTIVLGLAVIWGGSFMATKLALSGFGPFWLVSFRVALAALVLIAVAGISGRGLPSLHSREGRAVWAYAAAMGLIYYAAPFFLLSWGQQYVTSAFAGITMATVPLFVLPIAHILVPGETLSTPKAVGFISGFLGVVLLIGPDALTASTGAQVETWARLACVGAAFCYACGAILTRLSPPAHTFTFSSASLIMATLIILPVAIWQEDLPAFPPLLALGGLLYISLLSTALATLAVVQVVRSAGPTFLGLVNYQVPIWSVVFGTAFMGELLPPSFYAALVMILAGLAISQVRRTRRG